MATKYDIKDFLKAAQAAAETSEAAAEVERIGKLIAALDELEKPRDVTCNGWTNWETWTVRMALDGMEETMRDIAARESNKYRLGDQIKDYIQETIDELENETRSDRGSNRYFTDAALTSFMQEVNWTELAEYVLSDAQEADEYEHSGTWHILEPDAAEKLAFEGNWKECLAFIRQRAEESGEISDNAAQEIRADGNVIIDSCWYEIWQGVYVPELEDEEDDGYEPPVRDMDDAGN